MTDKTEKTDMTPAEEKAAAAGETAAPGGKRAKNAGKDDLSGPESLNRRIRVAGAPVWAVLIVLLAMLAGILVWAAVETVETRDENGQTEQIHPIRYVVN